jgi:hypothetical protein
MKISSINPAMTLRSPNDGAGLMVMKKALDTMSQEGQSLVNLLQQSAQPASPPNLGNTLDIKA